MKYMSKQLIEQLPISYLKILFGKYKAQNYNISM